MKISEFRVQIKDVYKKHFPESFVHVSHDKNLYNSIGISCCLAGGQDELSGGYWQNDMFHISFSVDADGLELPRNLGADDELPEVLRLEKWHSSYAIKPESKYMAYGREAVPYRRATGNAEKLIAAFDKFCGRLKDSVGQSIKDGKIHDSYAMIASQKLR